MGWKLLCWNRADIKKNAKERMDRFMQIGTYWTGKGMKSCFNCTKSLKVQGYPDTRLEPGEPASAECDCMDVDETSLDNNDENTLPKICGHYEPVVVKETCFCGKEINIPEIEHEYWFTWFYMKPCCSEECVKAAEKKAYEQENYDASLARYDTL
jgi:hypothetical protein